MYGNSSISTSVVHLYLWFYLGQIRVLMVPKYGSIQYMEEMGSYLMLNP